MLIITLLAILNLPVYLAIGALFFKTREELVVSVQTFLRNGLEVALARPIVHPEAMAAEFKVFACALLCGATVLLQYLLLGGESGILRSLLGLLS